MFFLRNNWIFHGYSLVWLVWTLESVLGPFSGLNMGSRGVFTPPGYVLKQYIVAMIRAEPVYRLRNPICPSISWAPPPRILNRNFFRIFLRMIAEGHYWTSMSSRWPSLNQYIASVTSFDPVYRLGHHYWPSILSWWPLPTQYIISEHATDPVYRNADPVYRIGHQYWPSISHRWPVLTQYIVTVTSNEPVYHLGDHYLSIISSQCPLLTQYIVTVTSIEPVYRRSDHHWTSISHRWPVLTQYIVSITTTVPVYYLGDHFRPRKSSQ